MLSYCKIDQIHLFSFYPKSTTHWDNHAKQRNGLTEMSFRKRWIKLLHRAATGTQKTRKLLTPIGVAIFGGFTALFVFAAILVDRLLKLPSLLPEGARLSVSIPMIAVGLAVTAWSAFHFLKVKGTPVPFNPPPQVVKTGALSVRQESYAHGSLPVFVRYRIQCQLFFTRDFLHATLRVDQCVGTEKDRGA